MKKISIFCMTILMVGFAVNLYAEEIAYEGINECGNMQVKVSFTHDTTKSTVNNFTAAHSCVKGIKGQGEITSKIDSPLSLKNNKFSVSNFVQGTISDGKASGKLIEAQGRSSNPDGKMYANCVNWQAKPKK